MTGRGARAPYRGRQAAPVLLLPAVAVAGLLALIASPVPEAGDERNAAAAPAQQVGAIESAQQGVRADSAEIGAAAPIAPDTGKEEVASLSYEREFFYYEGAGRRDPFKPLLDLDLSLEGPRFDELVLTGVFLSDEGGGMVVVEDADRKGYFLKLGDVVGRATLVEIHPDLAVFDVRDFGISRRETLRLQRPEETS